MRALVAVGGVTLIAIIILLWHWSWSPVFDDGPFYGIQSTECSDREPDQTLEIWRGLRLLVFDPEPAEPAPLVSLHDRSGVEKWCIRATASEHSEVRRLRFLDSAWFWPRVRGRVDWTYGRERSIWFLDREGELREYWYSW